MKKLIKEDNNEGLIKLLGEKVTLYCDTYIYAGTLRGVNDTCVLLENAEIVYNTGSHHTKEWELAESFPSDWYVNVSKIESFGVFK